MHFCACVECNLLYIYKNKKVGNTFYFEYTFLMGHAVAQLVEALRYKSERSRVQFPVVSMEFFIDIILPAALWPWGWLSL